MHYHNLRYSLLVLLSVFISSCSSTAVPVTTDYTTIKTVECDDKLKGVTLYFEGEKVDFEYEKLGLIEVAGRSGLSSEKLLDYLKYQAWSNCADAVINVKKDYKMIPPNTDDASLMSSDKVFYGLAVKKITQSREDSKIMTSDTSFAQTVFLDEYYSDRATKSNRKTAAVLTVLAIASYLVLIFL